MDEQTSQSSQTQQTTQTADSQQAARPDYIPEKFWDATKGEARVEDLAKGYATLESGRGKLKETLTAEINAERLKGRPEKPDGYKIGPAEGIADVVILDKAPEGDFTPEPGKTYAILKSDSKLAQGIRAVAHEYGVPQAKVSELVTEMAREIGYRPPTPEEAQQHAQAARAEFVKQLGDRGEERLTHTQRALAAALGDRAGALDLGKASVKEFEAIEALLEKSGQGKFSPGTGDPGPGMTRDQLQAIMDEPDYSVNPEKQRKVAEGYKKLFPGSRDIRNPQAVTR